MIKTISSLQRAYPDLDFMLDDVGLSDTNKFNSDLKRNLFAFFDDDCGVILVLISFEKNSFILENCISADKEALLKTHKYVCTYDVYKNGEWYGFFAVMLSPESAKAVA